VNSVILKRNDLPSDFITGVSAVAIDTETMGLLPHRDRLCVAQFSRGDGDGVVVQFDNYADATNIRNLLQDTKVLKIFHYARFDMMMLYKHLNSTTKNVYCTKIASKLSRTYTQKHGLADLCRDLLSIEISKEQTCTDWGAADLTPKQLEYAANDVIHLHAIKAKLDAMLIRENRVKLAEECFKFLETRAILDLLAGESYDIFAH
jgi:ribonuclease D